MANALMVSARRTHEPWAEIDKRPGLELTVDEHVMLVYRSPFYLFVSPSKKRWQTIFITAC